MKKDFYKAFTWWVKAAQQGHALAQFHLIDMYSKGKGVKKSRDKANYWYEKYKENL